MMVASGNVGTKLLTNRDEVNMYFTRDAGVTWKEFANVQTPPPPFSTFSLCVLMLLVLQGPYVPEFGDHGSIVVFSKAEEETTDILFTDNGGKEFTECQFTDTPVRIQNIRVSPQWNSKQFIILASDANTRYPLLFAIDFGDMHPNCTRSDTVLSQSSGLIGEIRPRRSIRSLVTKRRAWKLYSW